MSWQTLDGKPPLIIGHRGASGLRPENTLESFALAFEQHADAFEPDLVPSREGVLFIRHDPGMARSTDISSRSAFSDRQVEGDWRSETLTSAELDGLRAIQPFPGRSPAFDGEYIVPRWQALIDWAANMSRIHDTSVLLYPEIKEPADYIARGVDPIPAFIASVQHLPKGVSVRAQSFDAAPLKRVHDATGLPCCLLLDADTDWRDEIARHGDWISRVGVSKTLLWSAHGVDSGLVSMAHAAKIAVDVWTFRDDRVGQGYANVHDELRAAFMLGIDGAFCDFPATGLSVRGQMQIKPPY